MSTLMRGLVVALVAMVVGQVSGWVESRLSKRRRDPQPLAMAALVIQCLLGAVAFFYVISAYLGH
jgi:hypothetical protein